MTCDLSCFLFSICKKFLVLHCLCAVSWGPKVTLSYELVPWTHSPLSVIGYKNQCAMNNLVRGSFPAYVNRNGNCVCNEIMDFVMKSSGNATPSNILTSKISESPLPSSLLLCYHPSWSLSKEKKKILSECMLHLYFCGEWNKLCIFFKNTSWKAELRGCLPYAAASSCYKKKV